MLELVGSVYVKTYPDGSIKTCAMGGGSSPEEERRKEAELLFKMIEDGWEGSEHA